MVIDSGRGTYSAGGVRVTSQRLIDERGPLLSTSNATDLAVRGRGFLPVTREVERHELQFSVTLFFGFSGEGLHQLFVCLFYFPAAPFFRLSALATPSA